MSMPLGSNVARSSTTIFFAPNSIFSPAERALASRCNLPMGNFRSTRMRSIASPTAPVAPTMATLQEFVAFIRSFFVVGGTGWRKAAPEPFRRVLRGRTGSAGRARVARVAASQVVDGVRRQPQYRIQVLLDHREHRLAGALPPRGRSIESVLPVVQIGQVVVGADQVVGVFLVERRPEADHVVAGSAQQRHGGLHERAVEGQQRAGRELVGADLDQALHGGEPERWRRWRRADYPTAR